MKSKMCLPAANQIPKGWQRVCLKECGMVPKDSPNCSLYCSPNGKQFKTIEEVQKYNIEIERGRIEKSARSFATFTEKEKNNFGFVPVNNMQRIQCKLCHETFITNLQHGMHIRDVHLAFNKNLEISCTLCRMQFSTVAQKMSHMNLHVNGVLPKTQSVKCQKCEKMFQTKEALDKHLSVDHAPPGPAFHLNVQKSSLDSRIQNLQNDQNGEKRFNQVFRTSETESRLKSIHGLNVTKKIQLPGVLPQQTLQVSGLSNLIPVGKPFSLPPLQNILPGPNILPPKNIPTQENTLPPKNILPKSQYSSHSPRTMLAAMERLQQIPIKPQIGGGRIKQENQSSSSNSLQKPHETVRVMQEKNASNSNNFRGVSSGRVAKRKSSSFALKSNKIHNNSYSKFQISVSQVCRFLNMTDYPLVLTPERKSFFHNYSVFENYYMPLVASINQGKDPLMIKTFTKAKWCEVIMGEDKNGSTVYFNKPRKNLIKVNVKS